MTNNPSAAHASQALVHKQANEVHALGANDPVDYHKRGMELPPLNTSNKDAPTAPMSLLSPMDSSPVHDTVMSSKLSNIVQ